MERQITERLRRWLEGGVRRPLVLRGARQVGKTWLVRDLAARCDRELIEVNFERDPTAARAFSSNDPRTIVGELELLTNRTIEPSRALLFIDEIQAAGEVLGKLRWFYEELPELAVVAAGSLLEFVLADHAFSMPVGRVTFEYVEPMSFPEFLRAHGRERLLAALAAWRPGGTLSATAHDQATQLWERYAMVGGMPAVVAEDADGARADHCRRLQADLVGTYRADFAKYAGRIDRGLLDAALLHIAGNLGQKLVYAKVADGVRSDRAKDALELLAQARLCDIIPASAANGVPLASEVSHRSRKVTLLDVGLLHALLGTPAASTFPGLSALAAPLRGRLADQLVGQQLRAIGDAAGAGPNVFYWQRGGGRAGEIDYLVQLDGRVVPIEVKAGAAGAMKSLHQFMFDKGLALAVRCDANPPSLMTLDLATTQGDSVSYRLLGLPHYLVWNLPEVIASCGSSRSSPGS